MFLSDLSIKRPIFAAVMMLALVTLGAFSYKRLAVDMFPDVEIPVVTIVTKFPGASPESVEREVSKKIEEAQLLDAIALEVRDAANAVREAGEIVNALAGTVGQAERLQALAEKGYEYGVKTRLDVDDAQLNRSRALGNLARARRDYLVAGAALRHAMGTLGDGIVPPAGGEPPFRPAESPIGIVREVLRGRPVLPE